MKNRITLLVDTLSSTGRGPKSVRAFCMEHGINYVSLHNAFSNGSLGIQTVHAFKRAVPDLNVNWLLYGEGDIFVPQMSQGKT